jgi:hypothetical protein
VKKQIKKLQLNRETVIRLDELNQVKGGMRGDTKECEVTDYCNSVYQCYT